DIDREGFHIQSSVANLVSNGSWSWPQSWLLKAPDLGLILDPALDASRADIRQWCDINGSLLAFSVAKSWEAFRPRGMQNSLKTHDRMRQWDVGVNTDLNLLRCALCDT
ncbi:hypothetical protein Tco_0252615, partial [Tanacetum coccineum]